MVAVDSGISLLFPADKEIFLFIAVRVAGRAHHASRQAAETSQCRQYYMMSSADCRKMSLFCCGIFLSN